MTETSETAEPTVNDEPPERAKWRKARLPSLAPSTTADDALADIVQGCVAHLRANERCLLARTHEEGVHQMRVAVRRLRSCLALYEGLIPEEQSAHIAGELKWLIRELGPARDWDVFVAEVLAPVLRQMPEEKSLSELATTVEGSRDAAYARAQAAVGSQRYIGLVLLMAAWAEGRGWRDGASPEVVERLKGSAEAIAHHLLQAILEELIRDGEGFETLDAEARHEVRIDIKKLRYATEFFASLYPIRRVTPYLAAMKSLQDALGTNNDVVVARKLLKRVVKPSRGKARAGLAYAAGLVVGWHNHVGDDRELELVRAWTSFNRRTPYWQGRPTAAGRNAVTPARAAERVGDDPPASEGTGDVSAPPLPSPVRISALPDTAPTPASQPSAPARRRQAVRRG